MHLLAELKGLNISSYGRPLQQATAVVSEILLKCGGKQSLRGTRRAVTAGHTPHKAAKSACCDATLL